MIRFQNITVGYHKELFKVHDLSLEPGKIYALVGANGSGKSTFFRSLLGQQPFLSGNVMLNNVPIDHRNIKQRSKQFAFVGSTFTGVEFLSVEELILLGRTPYIGSMGRYSQMDKEVLEETIELFGLNDFRSISTDRLSDGERQIAAIARAIAQETQTILLDEPTAFLDYGNKKHILDLLTGLAERRNKTIILSTHDIDLCLASGKIEILLINKEEKELTLCPADTSKEVILQKGFGIL